jgi:N6-adenosine-specific RNA methylase IME4
MKKYKVIYADPPWTYDDKAHAGERGVSYKYNTMSIPEIRGLNVSDYCDSDCALFLWCTMPFIPDALKIMAGWGFKYKTVAFVWVKTPRGKVPSIKFSFKQISDWFYKLNPIVINILDYIKWHWGMGSWTRANAEIVLLGVRGKPVRMSKGVHSIVLCQHLGEHSRKPDEVRKRIIELMGDVPRLEMFARNPISDGWDVWGDEVVSDVEIGPRKLNIGLLKKSILR